jgi:iron complex outermembrane receptor protein
LGDFRILARLSSYGEYYDNEAGGVFDNSVLFDLEGGYDINEQFSGTVGIRNVGDEQGCSTSDCGTLPPQILGLPYSQFTPFGFNGRFFYGRLTYNF